MNWEEIKEIIIRDTEDIFKTGNPQYLDINDGINLFKKVILHNVGSFDLDGLKRELPKALQEAYIDKIGSPDSLRVIATNLEAYLKKICVIAGKETTLSVKNLMLKALLDKLGITNNLTPKISEPIDPNSFKGHPNYLFHVSEAYQTRNKVHESPDYKRIEVLQRLTSLIIVYIHSALKYKNYIDVLPNQILNKPNDKKEIVSKEERYLYHFISYGNTTNKVKNQVITSYILNYLFEIELITIEELRKNTNDFFTDINLPIKFYTTIVIKLIEEKKILKEEGKIKLTEEERKRISKIQTDFETNRNIFFLYLEDLIIKYSIIIDNEELYSIIERFFENNYKIDIAEALDKGVEIKEDENKLFTNFITSLNNIIPDKSQTNNLFKDLIYLSKDSDFLLRMCAGKTFAKLTNPERFEQYVNEEKRTVYLDTQIILFALCLNYSKNVKFPNLQYEATEELIQVAKANSNIILKVSRFYIQEVAYQLKLALLLIPFEEIAGAKISNNIFYQFYWYLKENNLLDEEDNSFSEFMENWLYLKEEDAYETSFWSTAYNNLIEILEKDELNIKVETIEPIEAKYDAFDTIKDTLLLDRKSRSKNVIENDANMLAHLCNYKTQNLEPFFLTWDKEFIKFRIKYISKFKRGEVLSFHLFNPSKFINHVSLLKFKINPSAMTNGLISIMDTYNIHENTSTIWDIVNKYLNVDNIKINQRRRHISTLKDIFEGEFGLTLENFTDLDKSSELLQNIDEIVFKINDHYSKGGKYNINDYRKLLLSDEYFKKLTSIILKGAHSKEIESALEQINLLMDIFNSSAIDNIISLD